MTESPRKPRGRRPGREDTRATIQAAALHLFSDAGYDKVSLRAIAREADVDPALIHHYFDSKADLFAKSVLDLPLDTDDIVERILAGPREDIGRAAVREFLNAWSLPGGKERFTAVLRSAASDSSQRRPMSEFMTREVFSRVAAELGHADAKLRGQLAVSLLLGMALNRYVLAMPAFAKARDSQVADYLAVPMQHYLVDEWLGR